MDDFYLCSRPQGPQIHRMNHCTVSKLQDTRQGCSFLPTLLSTPAFHFTLWNTGFVHLAPNLLRGIVFTSTGYQRSHFHGQHFTAANTATAAPGENISLPVWTASRGVSSSSVPCLFLPLSQSSPHHCYGHFHLAQQIHSSQILQVSCLDASPISPSAPEALVTCPSVKEIKKENW